MLSILAFMKFKLRNGLRTHLPLLVYMFAKCLNILYKISHMRNASSSGKLLTITIVMIGRM